MPKLIGKAIAVIGVSAATIGSGFVVLFGPHSYNDYLNVPLALGLIGLGAVFAGYGLLVIAGDLAMERGQKTKETVHLTPRAGDYTTPPAWHMGDIGRPETQLRSLATQGRGEVKVVSVKASNVDAVIFVVALLAWTAAALYLFAPK